MRECEGCWPGPFPSNLVVRSNTLQQMQEKEENLTEDIINLSLGLPKICFSYETPKTPPQKVGGVPCVCRHMCCLSIALLGG